MFCFFFWHRDQIPNKNSLWAAAVTLADSFRLQSIGGAGMARFMAVGIRGILAHQKTQGGELFFCFPLIWDPSLWDYTIHIQDRFPLFHLTPVKYLTDTAGPWEIQVQIGDSENEFWRLMLTPAAHWWNLSAKQALSSGSNMKDTCHWLTQVKVDHLPQQVIIHLSTQTQAAHICGSADPRAFESSPGSSVLTHKRGRRVRILWVLPCIHCTDPWGGGRVWDTILKALVGQIWR